MIGWTRLVGATPGVIAVSFGCAGAAPKPATPPYFRSPPLDYAEAPRSASDGEVLGVLQHAPDDWLRGGATTAHAGPGWSKHFGLLYFEREQARAGHGSTIEAPACLPKDAPLAPEDAERQAAAVRSWLEAFREPPLPAFAGAVLEETHLLSEDLQRTHPRVGDFMSCDTR